MYDFAARLPVDHVLAAVRMIRSGSVVPAELLKLIGASVGEIGALMSQGPIFSLEAAECSEAAIDEAIAALGQLEFKSATADPAFDPTPYIPLILMLIEWLIKRRQG